MVRCANGLLVCLAESQILCACFYVRGTEQGVPEVLCWHCASIAAKVSTEFTLYLKYLYETRAGSHMKGIDKDIFKHFH